MLTVMLAAMALLADSTPAAAVPAQSPPEAAATAKAKTVESDIVCHKETPTGSTIPVKVCRSRATEAANRTEARKQLEQLQLYTPRPPGS